MNLDQYRAIKAQDAQQSTPTEGQAAAVVTQTIPEATPIVETVATPTEVKVDEPVVPATPSKIVIDGVGEVDVDELKKGYLRQSDYTRKTQEVSAKSKENEEAVALYQYLRQNPQLAQQILQNPAMQNTINPASNKISEIEERMYDLMLENDIRKMQSKYQDFNTESVLKIADSRGLTNLEDAYLIYKATKPTEPTSIEDVKKQIREELVKELALEQKNTQTLITSGNKPVVQENKPSLSAQEHKVASNMGLTDIEYVKWRDLDKKN